MKTVEDQLKEIRTASGKTLHDVQLKRSRTVAVVLASATVVSLIFMVFAFVQKSQNDAVKAELADVRAELEVCRTAK